jgi:Fe-S-cluster-containing hydrogenase component 2
MCAKVCPVNAIASKVKEKHAIDAATCIKCGACISKCKFGAIKEK